VQEAQVTATYVAVLSSEVMSDTKNLHAINRQKEIDDYQRERIISDAWTGTRVGLMLCLVVVVIAKSQEVVRLSLRPVPEKTRLLRDGAHLTADRMLTDTRTTATWTVTEQRPADEVHGRILTEQKVAIPAEIITRLADVARIRRDAGMPLRVVDVKMLERDTRTL